MGDRLMAQGAAETPRVDTVSYYDDSEPNWNERPYFTKVEEKRGRTGCHIAMGPRAAFAQCLDPQSFAAIPGDRQGGDKTSQQLADTMAFHGARVILSGLAGDEFTGGVPTPTPELSDLLVRMRLKRFGRQLKLWALATRKPWLYLVVESARALLPLALVPLPEHQRPAPWFRSDFVRRNHLAVRGYPARVRLWGALPSFAANLATLEGLRRELGTLVPQRDPLCERRYPFLDRDLLEFLFAIPREQLVRPGQRRSLMRRALAGIVPDDVLNRKRKAFVARAPIAVIQAEWPRVEEMSRRMALARLGIVSETAFRTALEAMRKGLGSRVVTLFRTLWVESWLRSLMHHGILFHWEPSSVPPALHMIPRLCSGPKSSAG
jgi:asparagine synthase (glutamine-hydrolysing)